MRTGVFLTLIIIAGALREIAGLEPIEMFGIFILSVCAVSCVILDTIEVCEKLEK